jgi:uncharacterized membrane protein YebE (DUF533 family)
MMKGFRAMLVENQKSAEKLEQQANKVGLVIGRQIGAAYKAQVDAQHQPSTPVQQQAPAPQSKYLIDLSSIDYNHVEPPK